MEIKCKECNKIIMNLTIDNFWLIEDDKYMQCPSCGRQFVNPYFEEKKKDENGS